MKKNYLDAGRDLLLFAVAVLLLVLTWENNLLATIAIVGLFLIRFCFWRSTGDLTVYLVGAVLGPSTEIIATRLGIWTYASPSLLNIPLWLPFAWGFAAVLFVRIAQNLLPVGTGSNHST
jgi:hypothetical protein